MPRSPPKSTSTMSSDMSFKLQDVCEDYSKLLAVVDTTAKSILKQSGASVERLERLDDVFKARNLPYSGATEGKRASSTCLQVSWKWGVLTLIEPES